MGFGSLAQPPLHPASEVLVIRPKRGWALRRGYSDEQIVGPIQERQTGVKAQDPCRTYGNSDAAFYKYMAVLNHGHAKAADRAHPCLTFAKLSDL